jgi:hypothetical protein
MSDITILDDEHAVSFISPADLVGYIGRGSTTDPGVVLAVNAACDVCRTHAELTFTAVIGGSVTLDGTGTDALLLPEHPVADAGTVLVDGEEIVDYVLTDNGILIRKSVEAPFSTLTWPMGRQNITVIYDYGYLEADMPQDVRMVALAIASRLVLQGPAIQEAVGENSMRFAVASTDLTAGEAAILRKYKRAR